eukprot:8254191-Pyramimonas_sp.AAC.1
MRLPLYTDKERRAAAAEGAAQAASAKGKGKGKGPVAPLSLTRQSVVQLAAKDCARLVVEGEEVLVYHVLDNTRGG